MTYPLIDTHKHCNPCGPFGSCVCCEQPVCMTCWENENSSHMNLDNGGQEALDQTIENQDLEAAGPCLECIFYGSHDINNPEQENYNEDLIYKVERYADGKYGPFNGYMATRWRSRIIIVGRKPKPKFRMIRGPFILKPIDEPFTDADRTPHTQ